MWLFEARWWNCGPLARSGSGFFPRSSESWSSRTSRWITSCRPVQWGTEPLTPLGLRHLTAQGIDPRDPRSGRPLRTLVPVRRESCQNPENRLVVWLLELLGSRLLNCIKYADREVRELEADRPLRGTLYDEYDLPRIARLQEARRRAAGLLWTVRAVRHSSLLSGVEARLDLTPSPVMRHVDAYRIVRRAVHDFLGFTLDVQLDQSRGERWKPTHRLYEQWVFLQLAWALRDTGLTLLEGAGLFGEDARRRFSFRADLSREALVH